MVYSHANRFEFGHKNYSYISAEKKNHMEYYARSNSTFVLIGQNTWQIGGKMLPEHNFSLLFSKH
jgi:hypothetical protein